jgi:hypothetical protein
MCFNVQDPHDPSVGLINGELAIPGILIRREVFDPVVNRVCGGGGVARDDDDVTNGICRSWR